MAKRPLKSYKFSLISSLLITVLILVLVVGFTITLTQIPIFSTVKMFVLIICALIIFVSVFLLLNYRIEKFMYNEIKQLYEELEPEYRGELNSLKDQATFRREFLGNIAHELKTPLFTVQGYILTLLDGALKDSSVNEKYLERANKGVERLTYIINDLDLLTKLEKQDTKLEIEEFDILELIKSVLELLEMQASKSDIRLELDQLYDSSILVNADRERVQQVLINLIMNSIKYGKKKGTTEISVQPIYENKIIVRVRDNGVGIGEEHLPRLFERFYRVDKSGNRRKGGTGLGLAIVKHIIEAHNEQIFIESKPAIGSEFSFTLDKAILVEAS
jgi:two-component system phosphate regulon sensor histidine kinase PhoR